MNDQHQQNKMAVYFENLIRKISGKGHNVAAISDRKLLELTDKKHKPLVKNLGNWIEAEGYLFFDKFMIPQPAGFKSEMGYRAYAENLMVFAEALPRVEHLFEVAIVQISNIINDPSKTNSASFRIPRMGKLENGMICRDLLSPIELFFDMKSTKTNAPFTTLFKSAHDLNLTALTIESLVEKASPEMISRLNNKIVRLAEYCVTLNDLLVEDTDRQRKDVMAQVRDNIITPLSEWAEAVSVFAYQVNTLHVEFTKVEEHIKSKM